MSTSLLAFAAFALILTLTPGLDTMLVIRISAVAGRRAGLCAVIGIVTGCLVWAFAGAFGVTAVLAASTTAFTVLRIAGAFYLCWLGVRSLLSARRPALSTVDAGVGKPTTAWSAFRTGLITNVLNPKVGVFYLSVLPQFVPASSNVLVASLALAAVHAIEGLLWLSVVVVAVTRVRRWLLRPVVRQRMEALTGVTFLGFGVLTLFSPTPAVGSTG